MRKLYIVAILPIVILLSSCNAAFLTGFAEGLANNIRDDNNHERCLSSGDYENCMMRAEIKQEISDQKNELRKQKRELEKLKRDRSWQCIRDGGVMVGSTCMK